MKTQSLPKMDDKERLPLGPATVWEVARLITLLHAKKINKPLSPTDIKAFLATEMAWEPSNHSLYNGILKRLRNDKALVMNILTDTPGATEAHPLTKYTLGSQAEEILRIRGPKIADRLNIAERLLTKTLPLLGDQAPADPNLTTNTGTLMRWLCLWAVASGATTAPKITATLRGLTSSTWPSASMVYRALGELTHPTSGALQLIEETSPKTVHLTAAGRQQYELLGSGLVQPVKDAIHFVTTAKRLIKPLQ